MEKITAIILAGGQGKRVGTATPKQFLKIHGKRIIDYTLETFQSSQLFKKIIVVTPDYLGGKTRLESIANALRLVKTPYVIIHDAVRPFVDCKILELLAMEVKHFAGVGVAIGLSDTIIEVKDRMMVKSLDRNQCFASQTPQAFQTKILKKACLQARQMRFKGTEVLNLIRILGYRVKILQGSPWYFKITTKPDVYAAEGYLREKRKPVAVVTGGGRGIGKEICIQLADKGYQVIVVARTLKEIKEVAQKIKGKFFRADISDSKQVSSLFRWVREHYGYLDVLVNNAGLAILKPIEKMTNGEWQKIINVNLTGAFLCTREALKLIRPSGVVVNITSSSTKGGRPGLSAYGSSKAGLINLTEVTALERRDIAVFAICPTRTNTQLRKQLFPKENKSLLLDPKDVAEVVVFCCLNDLSPISGQTFYLTPNELSKT